MEEAQTWMDFDDRFLGYPCPLRGQKQDLSHLGPAQCLARGGQPPGVKSDQGDLNPWALVPSGSVTVICRPATLANDRGHPEGACALYSLLLGETRVRPECRV